MSQRQDTIPHAFFHRVARNPQAVALRQKKFGLWRDITWAQYADQVNIVGNALLELGLEPGQCVSVIGENIPEWLYADLGTQAVGGIAVGIYTTNSAQECHYILDHSRSRFF
ncbi:MAG: AMP-binding protein, partial [Deltaproteobacteria bacterium]|nr:AMP-binding protein [Deltaproteobacteria bacterium]